MASFETFAAIKIRIEGIELSKLAEFDEFLIKSAGASWWYRRTAGRGVVFVDVELAERAVAWLKAHDVNQEPPERDTTKRCARADAVGAARGTCRASNNDCGNHEFRGMFGGRP